MPEPANAGDPQSATQAIGGTHTHAHAQPHTRANTHQGGAQPADIGTAETRRRQPAHMPDQGTEG
ncbi:hypothetical protein JCM33774_58100 [Actinophytocola sp. KF-1]